MSTQSKSLRIVYLKRTLKRLDGTKNRLHELVATGELTPEGAELGKEQLQKNRIALLTELRTLEAETLTH